MPQRDTQSTFGYKWDRFPIDGEERSKHFRPDHRIERYGWTPAAFADWIDGKTVLDAGCGMGWWTEFLTEQNPTGTVYGVDIAPDAVRRGVEIVDAPLLVGDMSQLPFPDGTFEYISCEEAIHHTPDPPSTLRHLIEKLREGGVFTMYIYKEKPLLRETADAVLREQTTEMNIEECMRFAERLTELGEELYEIDEEITVPKIDLLDVEAGTYSVHEFVYRHLLKCYFDWHTEDFEMSAVTNFDWYHPEYAYRYDESEVREMVAATGLQVTNWEEHMSGFCVRAIK